MAAARPPAPILRTARLVLRPIDEADLEPLVRLWNDPAVGRYLWDGKPVSRDATAAILRASRTTFHTDGYGLWAICLGDDVIGCCGLRPTSAGDVEMLFALRPDAWGRGLATEAARAVLAHARDVLRLPRVTAAANPENRASWRILEKIGMRPVGRTRTEHEELLLYAA